MKTNWKGIFYLFAGVWIAYTVLFIVISVTVCIYAWDIPVPIELPSQIWALGLLGMLYKYSLMGFLTAYSYGKWQKEKESK